MWSQRGAASDDQGPGGGWIHRCMLHAGFGAWGKEGGLQGAGQRWRRCSGVRRLMLAGGPGVGCVAGSPWHKAQQSLMLSGSEREARKTEMRNEREKGYLWISQPSAQKGRGWRWWWWWWRVRGKWATLM